MVKRLPLFITLVCVASAGCSNSQVAREQARRETLERHRQQEQRDLAEFRSLPACAIPALGDTSDWHRPERAYVALPSEYERDLVNVPSYIHGGAVWRATGGREFRIGLGYYGFESFDREGAEKCRLEEAGFEMLFVVRVVAARYTAVVWPRVVGLGPFERAYEASGPVEDRDFLLRVIQTFSPPANAVEKPLIPDTLRPNKRLDQRGRN